jgi:hypothetical protein
MGGHTAPTAIDDPTERTMHAPGERPESENLLHDIKELIERMELLQQETDNIVARLHDLFADFEEIKSARHASR